MPIKQGLNAFFDGNLYGKNHARRALLKYHWLTIVGVWIFAGLGTFSLLAETPSLPSELDAVKIVEKLGDVVDIQNLGFKDEAGKDVKLAQYFEGNKPVILAMAYYECPNLCTLLLNGMTNALRNLSLEIGKDYEVVVVSIDHKETPELAADKKAAYLKSFGRLNAGNHWHFLTGAEDQIQKLSSQVGFGYRWDPETKQYAHGSALFVLTGTGKISRILYGIEFPNKDLKLSLVEASDGRVGTILDRVLMFCYRYDSKSRGYAIEAMRVMRAGGAVMLVIVGAYIFSLRRREKKELARKASEELKKRQGGSV